jgi:hypothetical protein
VKVAVVIVRMLRCCVYLAKNAGGVECRASFELFVVASSDYRNAKSRDKEYLRSFCLAVGYNGPGLRKTPVRASSKVRLTRIWQVGHNMIVWQISDLLLPST